MPLESPLAYLIRSRAETQKEIERNEMELALLDSRIKQYNDTIAARPTGIPPSWEPILDAAGNIKGWMEPAYAARSVRL